MMQSTESQGLNLSISRNPTETQSNNGLSSVANGQQEIGNKNISAQKDLTNGKATFAERYSINSDCRNSTIRNGESATLDGSLQELRIDKSRKNRFEDTI